MCVHYERLFATVDGEKSSVWFSDDLDPTNWDVSLEGGGYIEIMGEKGSLLKVIRFNDYVYVFRSYGISRITAYGEQTDFSVITLYTSSGKIYPETVSVCGDRIIFLAQDGIYSFDGLKTYKILGGVFPLLEGENNSAAVSAYFNGRYYLACRARYGGGDDGMVNNTLLEYDIAKNSCSLIKGVDISSLTVIAAESFCDLAIAVRGEESGQAAALCAEGAYFSTPLLKCWKTPTADFGCPDKYKLIREIYIGTKTDITVSVNTENFSRLLYFKGGGISRAKVGVRCKRLSLEFYCGEGEAKISRPLIMADIL